jgi:tetratricopeptide (TPR) repeat protein
MGMLPLPESIRATVREALKAPEGRDADLLKRAYKDILFSLEGPADERVGRDILVLCAEAALKVRAVCTPPTKKTTPPPLLPACTCRTHHRLNGENVLSKKNTTRGERSIECESDLSSIPLPLAILSRSPALTQVGDTAIAAEVLDIYFLEANKFWTDAASVGQVELKDQFVCRALYARALVRSEAAKGLKGEALVAGVRDALKSLLEGLVVALGDPRYLFLVYDASVHYWNISRPLQKPGTRLHLIESSSTIIQALQKVAGHEEWKAHSLRLHALCLSDGGKNDEAIKTASEAHELCKTNTPSLVPVVVKLKAHIGSLSGKKDAAGDGIEGASMLIQYARSGVCKDADELKTTLMDAWNKVDPAADRLGEAKDEPSKGADLEVVAEIGWVAAQNGLLDLASWCSQRAAGALTLQPRVRSELTVNLIALDALNEKKGTLEPLAIDVHKDVVNGTDQALSSLVRLQDVDGIQDACQLIWTASLPLQQPNFRHLLTRVFAAATSALESVGSPLNRLRTALHLELAYCYVAEDMLAQANIQVSKGLALDYLSPDEEVQRTGYDRPLDRFFDPLARVLALKGSLYEDPEGVEDHVLLLAEQARDAKITKVKVDLLQRAVGKLVALDPVLPPSEVDESGDVDKETLRRAAKARVNLWGTIVKVAMDAKMMSLAHQVSTHVLDVKGWDLVRDKDIMLLQVEVNFIDGLACMELLRSKGLALIPPKTVETEGIFVGDATDELQNNAVSAFLKAMLLGASVNERWVVMNAATHIWNNYIALIKSQDYANLLPATLPLFAELCKLEDCDPALLGNFAHVVSSGYEHLALLTAANADGPVDEERAMDYKSLRLTLASQTFDGSDDIKKAIETCEAVLNRVDDKNTRRLSAMHARLQGLMGVASEVKAENDPVAQVTAMIQQISQPGKDTKLANDVLSKAMTLLRPAEGEVLGDLEVWARLGDAAFNAKSYGPAIECCKQAVVFLTALGQTAPPQTWYWGGVAECAYGNGIVALIRPAQQDRGAQDALKQKAFEHFVEAAKHGRRANRGDIVDYAARCFWNAATSFMTSAATRSVLTDSLEVILDACRATKVDDFSFLQSMYVLLFDCLVDISAWADGVKHVEAAFRVLPSTEHQPLWEYKVMFLSVMGQGVNEEMNKIKEYDEEMQAKVWASLAAQASVPLDAMKAHQQAIKVLEKQPWIKVDFMIDFAEWLYTSGQPAADAEDVLLSALDILLEMDSASSDVEMFGAGGSSMGSPRSYTSMSSRSVPASPAKSMKSTVSRTNTAASRANTAASIRASATSLKPKGPQPPDRLGAKQMRLMIRVFLMLSKMSGNNFERSDYLLMGQHYALRMLKEAIAEAVDNADAASEVAAVSVPDTLEEWATFTMTDELLSQIQTNTGDFEISMGSIGRPELFLAYVEYLCAGLESSSMHLQCLPVCQLGVLVAKVAAKNQSLVTVYHLRLATVADALFLSSAASMHEELAGPLELSAEELTQGREEVKHRELLKSSSSSNASRASSRRTAAAAQPPSASVEVPKLLRPFALRDYWLARGAYLVKRGAISAATALLQEAVGHAHAHDDAEVEAWAYFHLAKCAAYGNKPIDAIKLQHRGQLCGGDVAFWGENLADYTKYKLNTRDGQLSAKESLMQALKLLQSRLRVSSRGSSLDSKAVMANLHIELCHVMEAEIRNVVAMGGKPEAQYAQALNAVSEAISLLQECGGGVHLVNAMMTKAMLVYKDPSARGDPRPRMETIKNGIRKAETEAERLFTAACTGTLNPLTTSLPAARLLAAVKNARAGCLLEIANAEKALEAYDREQNRPEFPTLQGMDASAITAFLDDCAPKDFERRLGPAEEAVVAASEASNLHKRNDGCVDSLHLLGEALLAVYDAQTGGKIWIEPPPPPPPPPPKEEGEGEGAETAPDGEKDAEGDAVEESSPAAADDAVASAPDDALGPDLMKPRAIRVLEQAIELGLKTAKYDMASRAATHLACAYGSVDPVNCSAALALAQSCRVTEGHMSIFTSAADEQDIESLLIQNQKTSDEMLNDTSSSKYSNSLLDRLQSSCKAWGRLQVKADQCLSAPLALPEELTVFSLQWIVGRGGETSLAIVSLSKNAEEAGAYVAPADAAQLATARKLVASYRGAVEKALVSESVMTGGPKPRTSVGGKPRSSVAASAPPRHSSSVAMFGGLPIVAPDDGSPLFDSFPVKAGWNEVCRAMEWSLAPVLSAWTSFLGTEGAKGKKIVLLVDEALASLPIEALAILDGAYCVTRDFSLHMLLQRVSQASSGDVQAGEMTHMVDLRYEDAPPPESEAGAEATLNTIPAQFAGLKDKFGTNWAGLMGSAEGIPGDGECQRVMSGAKSLLYYGHGRFLSYVTPAAVACIDLSQCQLALLACNTINEEVQRKQAKLDNRKSVARRSLEDPYQTAALLSMRGVDTVVLPTFSCTAEGNAELLRAVLSSGRSADSELDVAGAVWKAGTPTTKVALASTPEGEEAPPPPDAEEEDTPPSTPFSQYTFVVYGLGSVKVV